MVCQLWERTVGATVIALIVHANYGRWPRNLDDWVEVAFRYGLNVNIGPAGTFLYGRDDLRVAFIKWKKSRRQLHNHIAHEVAEHLVRIECEAPYQFPEKPGSRHRIACYVQAYDRRVRETQKRGYTRYHGVGCDSTVH